MKKWIILGLVISLLLGLCGCVQPEPTQPATQDDGLIRIPTQTKTIHKDGIHLKCTMSPEQETYQPGDTIVIHVTVKNMGEPISYSGSSNGYFGYADLTLKDVGVRWNSVIVDPAYSDDNVELQIPTGAELTTSYHVASSEDSYNKFVSFEFHFLSISIVFE